MAVRAAHVARGGPRDDRRAPADAGGAPAATRPPEQLVAEQFTAPPPVKATDGLTPERSAAIVRQSSSARWVGFLGVCFVALFVVAYWFYELGAPLGLSKPRLEEEIEHQQVVGRRARLQHLPGELRPLPRPDRSRHRGSERGKAGYIGPILNSQEKLFAHLNEQYLRNVFQAGGRYVCGNADVADAALGGHGQPARTAELPPDRRAASPSSGRRARKRSS